MSKIKSFFYIFYKSLTSASYYRELLSMPLAFSMKYFLTLAILFTLISTSIATFMAVPKINKFVAEARVYTINSYPSDLEIIAKNGSLTTNQPEPYMIPAPEEFKESLATDTSETYDDIENIVVFDSDGTLDDLVTYKTIALVNNKNILIKTDKQSRERIEVMPTEGIADGTLTKATFEETVNNVASYAKYIPYVLFALMFVGLFVFNVFIRMIGLATLALLLMLVSMLVGIDLKFPDLYKIAVHTLTFALVFELLASITNTTADLNSIGFLINAAFGALIVFYLAKGQTEVKSQPVVTVPSEPVVS